MLGRKKRDPLNSSVIILGEMARMLSLVDLQKRGNKKAASKTEIRNARKKALRIKDPGEARATATEMYLHMRKKELIQVYLDREAELISPAKPIPKPLFMDKKVVKWASLSKREITAAAKWVANNKTEEQILSMASVSKKNLAKKITPDGKAKLVMYEVALKIWRKDREEWKRAARYRETT